MNIEPAKYPMILSPDEAASITASLTRMGLIGEHEEPELEPRTADLEGDDDEGRPA